MKIETGRPSSRYIRCATLPSPYRQRRDTDQLEARGVELLGQMQLPAEGGHHRAFDGRRRIVRAQQAVRGETLHVVGGELRGQHARRVVRRLIEERAADEQHQARRERQRRPTRHARQAPGRPTGLRAAADAGRRPALPADRPRRRAPGRGTALRRLADARSAVRPGLRARTRSRTAASAGDARMSTADSGAGARRRAPARRRTARRRRTA